MSEPKKVACVERVMQQSSGLHRTMPIKSAVMVGVGGTSSLSLFIFCLLLSFFTSSVDLLHGL